MYSKLHDLVSPFLSREAAKFLVAGASASLVNWLVRFPLSTVMPLIASVVCAYIIGMFFGFWLYRQWVFERSSLPLQTEILRFCGVNIIGLIVASGMTSILVAFAQYAGLTAKPAVIGGCHAVAICLGAIANFIGHKFITFSRSN